MRPFVAFDLLVDYDIYLGGKTRANGTHSFLQASHSTCPAGSPDYPPGTCDRRRTRNAKDRIFLGRIRRAATLPIPVRCATSASCVRPGYWTVAGSPG